MEIKKETLQFDTMEDVTFTANVSAREPLEDGWEVLSATARACVTRCEVLNREAVAEGTVAFCALLKDREGRFRKAERNERFSVSEPIAEDEAKSSVFLNADAQKVRVCAEAGSLLYACRVELRGVQITPREKECVTLEAKDTLKCKQTSLAADRVLFALPLRFSHSFEIELSPRLPEAREVLCGCASAFAREVHLSAGQLVLGGCIALQTTYRSDDEYEPILQVSDEEDFSQIVEVTQTAEGGRGIVSLSVESVETEVRENEEGERRLIAVKADLCGWAVAVKKEEKTVLTDAYSLTSSLTCKAESMTVSSLCDTIRHTFNRSVSVRVPEGKPPVSRINAVSFCPSLTVNTENGSIEGIAETSVLYTASGTGETEGFYLTVPVRFTDVFPPEENENVQGAIGQISLTDMQATLASGRELEVRAGFSFTCMPVKEESCRTVCDASEEEKTPSEYGIVLYRVQKNETLWDVSKKFCVDESELLSFNPGASSVLREGECLFVFQPLIG